MISTYDNYYYIQWWQDRKSVDTEFSVIPLYNCINKEPPKIYQQGGLIDSESSLIINLVGMDNRHFRGIPISFFFPVKDLAGHNLKLIEYKDKMFLCNIRFVQTDDDYEQLYNPHELNFDD